MPEWEAGNRLGLLPDGDRVYMTREMSYRSPSGSHELQEVKLAGPATGNFRPTAEGYYMNVKWHPDSQRGRYIGQLYPDMISI